MQSKDPKERVEKLLRADIPDIYSWMAFLTVQRRWQKVRIKEEKDVKLLFFMSVIHRWD